MSADNEIAILEDVKNHKFYVAHIQGCPSDSEVTGKDTYYRQLISKEAVINKNVFCTEGEATDCANLMARSMREDDIPLEYGITFYEWDNREDKSDFANKGEAYDFVVKSEIEKCNKQIDNLMEIKKGVPGHLAEVYELGIKQWNVRLSILIEIQEEVDAEGF